MIKQIVIALAAVALIAIMACTTGSTEPAELPPTTTAPTVEAAPATTTPKGEEFWKEEYLRLEKENKTLKRAAGDNAANAVLAAEAAARSTLAESQKAMVQLRSEYGELQAMQREGLSENADLTRQITSQTKESEKLKQQLGWAEKRVQELTLANQQEAARVAARLDDLESWPETSASISRGYTPGHLS